MGLPCVPHALRIDVPTPLVRIEYATVLPSGDRVGDVSSPARRPTARPNSWRVNKWIIVPTSTPTE